MAPALPVLAVAEFSDQVVLAVYLVGSLALGVAASRWFRRPQVAETDAAADERPTDAAIGE